MVAGWWRDGGREVSAEYWRCGGEVTATRKRCLGKVGTVWRLARQSLLNCDDHVAQFLCALWLTESQHEVEDGSDPVVREQRQQRSG